MANRRVLVLSAREFPLSELCAMRLDGELFGIDDCFASLDEFESPALRAAAVASGRHPRLIAEQWTAAWVWGAVPAPPARHTFCVRLDARVGRVTSTQTVVREVALDPAEESSIGPLRLTTPLRTVTDLGRWGEAGAGSPEPPVVVAAIAALRSIGGLSLARCLAELERTPHLPHKKRAQELLRRSAV
ncbi:hypothetical protein [Salinibacterium sp. ZJ454]|uniref:hypothetical protein n=1 Tax=Salinibacterium sp. ZJ454 TaxID=2708339 RepID=UPI00141E3515|nr:hypothetical protein [Salinibacterium sp. ZJ454]